MNKQTVIVLTLLLFFVSCSSDKKNWEITRSENTKEAYKQFLRSNPRKKYLNEAERSLDQLLWLESAEIDTVESYQEFALILCSDGSPELKEKARDMATERLDWLETFEGNIGAYEIFIKKHPENNLASIAENWISLLLQGRKPELKDVRTYKLIVTQSYDKA
ncbi:MAG: hypothetical protein MUP98_17185 [Candidatus Aminicenantes bacterium]|nr:hypothetical protein [Candidatus Aminicenantes bacterium]